MVSGQNEPYYCAYHLIIHVDNILCTHHQPKQVMDVMDGNFCLKSGVEDKPHTYLLLGTNKVMDIYTRDTDYREKLLGIGESALCIL